MFLLSQVVSAARLFSTSAVAQAYKLKSHSGAKKRWRSLASGTFKRARVGHQHLNTSKSTSRKNRLSQTAYSHDSQTVRLKKLLPYGSP